MLVQDHILVTNSGSASGTDGSNNPTLNLLRGPHIHLILMLLDHPFNIKTFTNHRHRESIYIWCYW